MVPKLTLLVSIVIERTWVYSIIFFGNCITIILRFHFFETIVRKLRPSQLPKCYTTSIRKQYKYSKEIPPWTNNLGAMKFLGNPFMVGNNNDLHRTPFSQIKPHVLNRYRQPSNSVLKPSSLLRLYHNKWQQWNKNCTSSPISRKCLMKFWNRFLYPEM